MSGEALVRVPSATVYKVERASHAVNAIANGDFVVAYAGPGDDAGLLAQVGPVSWPLGRWAATLRFDDHTYAFQLPQLPYDGPGCFYYCLTLQPDTPLELIDLLQAVLASGSAYHDQERLAVVPGPPAPPAPAAPAAAAAATAGQPPAADEAAAAAAAADREGAAQGPTNADRIAAGLQRGGQIAAAGVLLAACWAGKQLHRGAEAAVARMQPAERQKHLSPEAQARLERARSAAAKAAEVSGRAVEGALSVTSRMAGALAQRISSTELGRQLSQGRTGQSVRKVGTAGVEAVEAVYDSLADAARVVLAHTHAAATRVAGHKYGPGAAQATGAGIELTQSVVQTGLNVYKLRPTALAKEVIKGAGKEVVLGGEGNGNGSNGGVNSHTSLQPAPPPPPLPAAAAASGSSVSAWAPAGAASGPGSFTAAPAPAPSPPSAPLAAAALLSALSAPPPPPPPQQHYGTVRQGSLSVNAGGGGGPASGAAVAGGLVQGVAVSGPVPAHPVMVDYTPSAAAALYPPTGSGTAGQLLPYPAVSAAQYDARYYPAIPRA